MDGTANGANVDEGLPVTTRPSDPIFCLVPPLATTKSLQTVPNGLPIIFSILETFDVAYLLFIKYQQ